MSGAPRGKAGAGRRGKKRCPLCKALATDRYWPFCSARCRDIDLGRWLSGAYAVPAVEADDELDDDGGYPERDG